MQWLHGSLWKRRHVQSLREVDGRSLAERWHTGRWVGKRMGTEEHFVMQADGKVVRARAVREMEMKLALSDFDVLVSTPPRSDGHDQGGREKWWPRGGTWR